VEGADATLPQTAAVAVVVSGVVLADVTAVAAAVLNRNQLDFLRLRSQTVQRLQY
jgi:hypothetical protein